MSRLVLLLVLAVTTSSYGKSIKIVGGKNTTIDKHPYQISLEIANIHRCGGSLIRPDVVLTAAHCTIYSPKLYSVRAGATIEGEGGQIAKVLKICNHPKYDPLVPDYDVSVIKLDKAFKLNSSVRVIKLQNIGKKVRVGTFGTVTGWGALDYNGESSKILQEVKVPKMNLKKCKKDYPSLVVTNRMTCYGYGKGGKDACQGDSGGPLVVNKKQVGIVSFGIECARPNKPGVYTRIANKEIHDYINKCLAKFSEM